MYNSDTFSICVLSVSLTQEASPFQPGRHYTYPTLDVFGGTHNILWSGALPSQVAHDFVTGWAKTGGAFTMDAPHKPGAFAGFCPFTQFGHGYGLLALDLVEQFQIFAFFMLGQAQTPGTWTAAECLGLDRTGPSGALRPTGGGMGSGYVAPSQALMPTLVKWLCQFEDYSGVLWLGKALPREWLAPGAPAVRLERSPSSLGRLSFTVQATGATTVTANLTLPKLVEGVHHASVAGGGFAWPEAGIKLRLRSALFPAKKITSVTVTPHARTARWHLRCLFCSKHSAVIVRAGGRRSVEGLQCDGGDGDDCEGAAEPRCAAERGRDVCVTRDVGS